MPTAPSSVIISLNLAWTPSDDVRTLHTDFCRADPVKDRICAKAKPTGKWQGNDQEGWCTPLPDVASSSVTKYPGTSSSILGRVREEYTHI